MNSRSGEPLRVKGNVPRHAFRKRDGGLASQPVKGLDQLENGGFCIKDGKARLRWLRPPRNEWVEPPIVKKGSLKKRKLPRLGLVH